MKIEIQYIFHNCFMVKLDSITLLFDYPADSFLEQGWIEKVKHQLKDTSLYYFVSHGHPDHFNPNLDSIRAINPETTFVLSDDIAENTLESPAKTVWVSADTSYTVDSLQIITYKSSDLGVAFLIQIGKTFLYFGGDLANWNWDELPGNEKLAMEQFYQQFLEQLSEYPIDLAFVNTDPRMKNWAGAEDFLVKIKPQLFIPMHTFGRTKLLKKFIRGLKGSSNIFVYQNPGDSIIINL